MSFADSVVTVEFRDKGEETEIVLHHEFFPAAEIRDAHEQGWNGCIDRFAEIVQ